jgi:beta-phosphoglucomutase
MGHVVRHATTAPADICRPLSAAIFDVDGVIIDSPHERAWREALQGFADPQRFTTALYEAQVAGKPRLAGARAVLEQLGVPDAACEAARYADRKQQRMLELIEAGSFVAFADALRFVQGVRKLGLRAAVASSSKNANRMLAQIRLESGGPLLDCFDANLCGRDVRRGKPDPEIFLLAAAALAVVPDRCIVIEDAPAGITAAKRSGMAALGVARLKGAASMLHNTGADLVVCSLDEVAVDDLAIGRVRAR